MMRLGLCGVLAAGLAWGAAPPAAPTAEQKKQLFKREIWIGVCRRTFEEGKKDVAAAALEEVLAIELQVFGPWHADTARTAEILARWRRDGGDWAREAERRRTALEARARLRGPGHWQAVDARLGLEEALAQAGRTPSQREALLRARLLEGRAAAYYREGRAALGVPLAREAVALHRAAVGERHPAYATSLNVSAVLHAAAGRYDAAVPLAKEALAVRLAVLGGGHPDTARSLNNLAEMSGELGDHKAALRYCRRALAACRAAGEQDAEYASCLNSLGRLHQAIGDLDAALDLFKRALAVAESLEGDDDQLPARLLNDLAVLHKLRGDNAAALAVQRKALALIKAAAGERHPDYATALENLASLHARMWDNRTALRLYEEALGIREVVFGRGHPMYALSLHNLALLRHEMGAGKAGLPLALESLGIYRASLGRRHPHYAAGLSSIAGMLSSVGEHGAALPLLTEALALREEAVGEWHPDYAATLHNLATLHQDRKNFGAAIPLFQRSLEIKGRSLGGRHPQYGLGLHNLAAAYFEAGRPGTALVLQEQCLAITRRQLARDASAQSERQQLEAADQYRYYLGWRLSTPEESAWQSHTHALWWKGSAFAAQQARRRFVRALADPSTRRLAGELLDTTRTLAMVSSRPGEPSRERVKELEGIKEVQEGRLSELSASFRSTLQPPPSERFRASLPPGIAIVDFLAYRGLDPGRPLLGQTWGRRLAAWVVRPDAPTVRLDLGEMGPIEEAVAAWRKALEVGRDPGAAPSRLREAVWRPAEKHLVGASVVLISPDGALGRLPFAALPGARPGSHLLDERRLAVLPIPQALPGLLTGAGGEPSLLAVGGVEFGEGPAWADLPATGAEADAVAARFRARFKGGAASLSGKATKAAVRDALTRHRFCHLATHGFFAPPSMRSVVGGDTRPGQVGQGGVPGWHPGLLTGLVFAGANRPTAEDDGILTALEIAETDLSGMELAVLSACQTGLGMEAAGEGMLGLQRAFAVAGCRSVVSSLWSVDDAATGVLMERFYHHLWDKKLSKIEALRQAQLDVMRHPEWVEARAKKLRGTPGLRGVGKVAEVTVSGKKERRSPDAWWGAWQLSGDWR